MPKNKSSSKSATGAITRSRTAHKLRIGTRKSGKSALLMSTDALLAVLEDKEAASDHLNAKTALLSRKLPK